MSEKPNPSPENEKDNPEQPSKPSTADRNLGRTAALLEQVQKGNAYRIQFDKAEVGNYMVAKELASDDAFRIERVLQYELDKISARKNSDRFEGKQPKEEYLTQSEIDKLINEQVADLPITPESESAPISPEAQEKLRTELIATTKKFKRSEKAALGFKSDAEWKSTRDKMTIDELNQLITRHAELSTPKPAESKKFSAEELAKIDKTDAIISAEWNNRPLEEAIAELKAEKARLDYFELDPRPDDPVRKEEQGRTKKHIDALARHIAVRSKKPKEKKDTAPKTNPLVTNFAPVDPPENPLAPPAKPNEPPEPPDQDVLIFPPPQTAHNKPKPKKGHPEVDPNLSPEEFKTKSIEKFKNMGIDIEKQPATTREIIEQAGLFMEKYPEQIQGKNIIALKRKHTRGDGSTVTSVEALVQSDKNPDEYEYRLFRMSGSDHQYKVHPGLRDRKTGELIKGEERTADGKMNPNHHYVQSGKLHPDLYQALDALPLTDSAPLLKKGLTQGFWNNRLPAQKESDGKTPTSPAELERIRFSEEQIDIKNPNWKLAVELIQNTYRYLHAKSIPRPPNAGTPPPSPEETQNLQRATLGMIHYNYDIAISGAPQRSVANVIMESGIVPDFTKEPLAKYEKSGPNGSSLQIEEFEVKSPENDTLRWAMATDKQGRMYCDNIYDPDQPMDDYGTPQKKLNMGMLVYKPEDYTTQTAHIPDHFKHPIGEPERVYDKDRRPVLDENGNPKFAHRYTDIHRFIALQPPIKAYIDSKTATGAASPTPPQPQQLQQAA